MKFLVTFLLLISIGEIYSKTLLEKISDDSDLSEVSALKNLSGFGSPLSRVLVKNPSPNVAKKAGNFFGFSLRALHNRWKKRVLCNMSVCFHESIRCSGAIALCTASVGVKTVKFPVPLMQLIEGARGRNFN